MTQVRRQLVGSLALALLAGLLVLVYLRQLEARSAEAARRLQSGGARLTAVVANRTIAAGTLLSPELLELRTLPIEGLPPTSFRSLSEIEGQVAASAIYEGEPLRPERLSARSVIPSMHVPAGRMAFALPIDPEAGVGGQVMPGDHVDLIGADRPDGRPRILMSRVKVLGVAGIPPFGGNPDEGTTEGTQGLLTGLAGAALPTLGRPERKILILEVDRQDAVRLAGWLEMVPIFLSLYPRPS